MLSVGPGSEPGPALTSLVYNVIVAANARPDPSIGVRLTDSRSPLGQRLDLVQVLHHREVGLSPLAETEMVENAPPGSRAGDAGVRLTTCTPATDAAFRRRRITADSSAVGGTCPSIWRIVASFSGASSRACSEGVQLAPGGHLCCAVVSSSSLSASVTSPIFGSTKNTMSSSARIPAPAAARRSRHAYPASGTPLPRAGLARVTAAVVRSTPDEYVIGPVSGSAIEVTHGLTQPRTRSRRISQDAIVS